MILYQALSSYQILECIVHRLTFHAGEKAELMLGNYILERMPQYREAATRGFFDRVLLFRYGGYRGDEEKILKEVREEFLSICGRRAEEYDKIYAAGIHTCCRYSGPGTGFPLPCSRTEAELSAAPGFCRTSIRKALPTGSGRWKNTICTITPIR